MDTENFSTWKKRNKMNIQVIALVLAVVSPFVLYSALNNGASVLAGIMFGAITLAMGLVAGLT